MKTITTAAGAGLIGAGGAAALLGLAAAVAIIATLIFFFAIVLVLDGVEYTVKTPKASVSRMVRFKRRSRR